MDKKKAILNAAISLFAERGFHATPTSALAKTAGVAEGLIFHYFKNKEGIFIHILDKMMDAYLEGIQANVKKASSGLEAIERVINFHLSFSDERSQEFLVLIRDLPFEIMNQDSDARQMIVNHFARVSALLRAYIEWGQRDGSVLAVPVTETSMILQGMLNGLSRLKLLGDLRVRDFTSEALNFCRRSLAKST